MGISNSEFAWGNESLVSLEVHSVAEEFCSIGHFEGGTESAIEQHGFPAASCTYPIGEHHALVVEEPEGLGSE